MDGFLLIDKPTGPTSHDMVDAVRRLTGIRRIGHAGTLDPFATGLLIIGVGKATKEMSKLVGLDKEYEATLKLGTMSDTYDKTGKLREVIKLREVTDEEIKSVLKNFIGTIEQIPPMYSAKKMKGKKLYELARKGIEVERKPIEITIYSIDIVHLPTTDYRLQLNIKCSSGTYIRSLAHDIGQTLGCGAYLEELRRTAIGPFRIEESAKLPELNKTNIQKAILPVETILSRISHSQPSKL